MINLSNGRYTYGPASTGHIRVRYFTRWSESPRPNLRQISSRIAVAVREDNTYLTREAVTLSRSEITASGTGFRRVRRINVDYRNADATGLIFNEVLKLPPGPAVQSCAHAFANPDPLLNVRQVFQDNCAEAARHGLSNDFCTNLVIDMAYVTRLSAGDSLQQLSCGLRAVALKPPAQCRIAIAPISKFSTSMQGAGAECRGYDLSHVHAHYGIARRHCMLRNLKREMQKPTAPSKYEVGLARASTFQIALVELSDAQRDVNAAIHRKKRHAFTVQAKRAGIVMDGRIAAEVWRKPWRTSGAQRAKRESSRRYGVARHLRAEFRKPCSQRVVRQVMQADAIRTSFANTDSACFCAGCSKGHLHRLQCGTLIACRFKRHHDGALHKLQHKVWACHTPVTLANKERRIALGLKAKVRVPAIP